MTDEKELEDKALKDRLLKDKVLEGDAIPDIQAITDSLSAKRDNEIENPMGPRAPDDKGIKTYLDWSCDYIKNEQFYKALVALKITVGRYPDYFLWSEDNRPKKEKLDEEIATGKFAEDFSDVGDLLSAEREITRFNRLIMDDTLRALWMLDRYLFDVSPKEGTRRARKESIQVPQRPADDYYVIPTSPKSMLQAKAFDQTTNVKRYHACHRIFRHKLDQDGSGREIIVNLEKNDDHVDSVFKKLNDEKQSVNAVAFFFDDNVSIDWRENAPGYPEFDQVGGIRKVVAYGMKDETARIKSIKNSLEFAHQSNAHIVVFPELTVSRKGRKVIQEWLEDKYINDEPTSICWVVAGSFHFDNEQEDASDLGGWFNNSVSFNVAGEPIMYHNKLGPFGSTKMSEGINRVSNEIPVYVSPIGSLSTPICLDFCQRNGSLRNAFTHFPVDWCLVPAMDSSVNAHYRMCKELNAIQGTHSIVAVQTPFTQAEKSEGWVFSDQDLAVEEEAKTANPVFEESKRKWEFN